MSYLEIFINLLSALLLGVVLGAERSFAGKTAGMRTYGLVSMGSALFVVISKIISDSYLGLVNFDPMRVVAGIITGIGFLGAGLIIFRDSKLNGLTTAAGLWVSSGIGIAVGYELYGLAILATLLTLLTFTLLWFLEKKVKMFSNHDSLDNSNN